MSEVIVREYKDSDAQALAEIFYNTIHAVNTLDYNEAQIAVWAPESRRQPEIWREKWQKLKPWVAVINEEPVGFAEFEEDGHIDCFYVHHRHQGKGIGSALMNRLHEQAAMQGVSRLFAEVSISARPFFLRCGFKIDKVNTVVKDGVELRNFVMSKALNDELKLMRSPELETDRLILCPAKYGDALPLNKAINSSLEQLQRWMPWALDPRLETTEQFVAGSVKSWSSSSQRDFPMVICLKETGLLIGASGFNDFSNPDIPYFDLGYWLETSQTGNGYATELVNALSEFAFDGMGAKRVQIRAQKENLKSRAVAERSGFTLEAEMAFKVKDCKSGEACSDMVYVRFK